MAFYKTVSMKFPLQVPFKAGPSVAAGIGRRLYDHHRHALRITLQEHKDSRVEKSGTEVKTDKETGL